MCNCKCKDKEIKTIYVKKEWGEQMMFAVPPDMRNVNDSVSVVDEIRDEVLNMINGVIKDTSDFNVVNMGIDDIVLKTVNSSANCIKDAIEEIFDKYSE